MYDGPETTGPGTLTPGAGRVADEANAKMRAIDDFQRTRGGRVGAGMVERTMQAMPAGCRVSARELVHARMNDLQREIRHLDALLGCLPMNMPPEADEALAQLILASLR